MSAKRSSPLRVAVLASGRGSNLQAIIDAIEAGQVQAQIVAVISNKKDAVALERARKHGLPDLFVDPKPFAGQPDSREAYDRALLEVLQQRQRGISAVGGLHEDCDGGPGQRVCQPDDEHSSLIAPVVSRLGGPKEGDRLGLQIGGMHRPLRHGRRG